jgi:hypothetical protein
MEMNEMEIGTTPIAAFNWGSANFSILLSFVEKNLKIELIGKSPMVGTPRCGVWLALRGVPTSHD